jgi:hypothetical protein
MSEMVFQSSFLGPFDHVSLAINGIHFALGKHSGAFDGIKSWATSDVCYHHVRSGNEVSQSLFRRKYISPERFHLRKLFRVKKVVMGHYNASSQIILSFFTIFANCGGILSIF